MSATETVVNEARSDAQLDDLDHVTCCRNDDLTLCGMDASLMPFTEFEVPSCIVCDDLEIHDDGYFCPYFGRCPE